jgi:type IV pilus assembly protein PilV
MKTTTNGNSNRQARRQRGFTIIEAMVALFVISVGLLGVAGLQARGMRYNHDAYIRSQATILAYDIMDKMRMVRANITDNEQAGDALEVFAVADDNATCSASMSSSGTAANQRICWYAALAANLPGGTGTIAQTTAPAATHAGQYQVTVTWTNPTTSETVNQEWMFQP